MEAPKIHNEKYMHGLTDDELREIIVNGYADTSGPALENQAAASNVLYGRRAAEAQLTELITGEIPL